MSSYNSRIIILATQTHTVAVQPLLYGYARPEGQQEV